MAVTVGANFLSLVHKESGGVASCFPDVCKTPAPTGAPLPIPYPNVARSADASKTAKRVKADGQAVCVESSNFSTSTGDEPGSVGGVVSGKVKGKAEFVNHSFDVKVEGKGVTRSTDLMLHNNKNTPPFPLVQGPIAAVPGSDDPVCTVCGKKF